MTPPCGRGAPGPPAGGRLYRKRIAVLPDFLEVDALVHGQALEVAAQAVEPHLGRAETHPFAAADDAAASRGHAMARGDREAHRAAELDPVGAFVKVDQHRQRMRGSGMTACSIRHCFSSLAADRA